MNEAKAALAALEECGCGVHLAVIQRPPWNGPNGPNGDLPVG